MALVSADEINASIDSATTLNRPRILKQTVYASSTALLYIEARQARPGKSGWVYIATASNTVTAAGSVSAAVANLV